MARYATDEELERAVRRYGPKRAAHELRRYGLVAPIAGASGWTNTAAVSNQATATGAVGITLPSAVSVTTGQVVGVLAEFYGGTALTPTFTDTDTNVTTWNTAGTASFNANGVTQAIGWGVATATGNCLPKVTWSAGGSAINVLYVAAFNTPGGTVSQDGSATSANSTSNGGNVATVVLPAGGGSNPNALLLNVVSFGNSFSSIAGSWVYIGTSTGDGGAYLLNAPGNSTPNITQSPSGSWASLVVALQASGGGAGGTPASVFPVFLPRRVGPRRGPLRFYTAFRPAPVVFAPIVPVALQAASLTGTQTTAILLVVNPTFQAASETGTLTAATLSLTGPSLTAQSKTGSKTTAGLSVAVPVAASSRTGSKTTASLSVAVPLAATSKTGSRTTATFSTAASLSAASKTGTRTTAALSVAVPLAAASKTGSKTAATPSVGVPLQAASRAGTRTTATLSTSSTLGATSATGSRTTASLTVAIPLHAGSKTGTRTTAALSTSTSLAATSRTGTRTTASVSVRIPLAAVSLSGSRTGAALAVRIPLAGGSRTGTGTTARFANGAPIHLSATSLTGTSTVATATPPTPTGIPIRIVLRPYPPVRLVVRETPAVQLVVRQPRS